MAFKLMVGMISDGKHAIPFDCAYLFTKELVELAKMKQMAKSKNQIAIAFIKIAQKLFPNTKIIMLADGLYSNVEVLEWCCKNGIKAEMRMHKNRVVFYKGQKFTLGNLLLQKGIMPKGRQMARTVSVQWHKLDLELTIVRCMDKKGKESIVFQIATYKALPREHVAHYKNRWVVEKCFRTSKQGLGLEECFSKILSVQHNQVSSVLLAYALVQLEMKMHNLKHAEAAVRSLKMKKLPKLINRFAFINRAKVQFDA